MKRTRAWPLYVGFALGGFTSSLCSAESPADSLSDCTSVADEKSRLKCYDEQMARAGKKIPQPSSSAPPPAAVPAPAPSARAAAPSPKREAAAKKESGEFGLDAESVRKKREAENAATPDEPMELTARVKGVSERAHGEYRIELDNGQVWVETLRTGGTAPAEGEPITIKRGMLGSFYLTRQSGLALRVKRIK